GTRAAPATLAGAPLGINERAQIVETVYSEQACSNKFPERGFHFRLQLRGATHDVKEKRCAALPQELQNSRGILAEPNGFAFPHLPTRHHPLRIFAHEENNQRNADKNNTPLSIRERFERRGMQG